jgi:hypothetical protein
MRQYEPLPESVCAFYGRVSTPKQKLEQQWTTVSRWCDETGVSIPASLRFQDKEKRHKSNKRKEFQRLLKKCENGEVEWIVIAAFDRWGVADVDEFFEIRRKLRDSHVRLWSVQDRLDLTGCDDSAYFRIISLAVAATAQMKFYADRNIQKMIDMALNGWHASSNHPYGTDLLCCSLDDKSELFRVQQLTKPVKGEGGRSYKIIFPDGTEEITNRMPLRDCKKTGYRLTPSLDTTRIEAVRLIYELFDSKMNPRQISKHLWARGIGYFGRPFKDNAIWAILKQPAYIGRPAWGKYAVGAYKHVLNGISEEPVERKREDPINYEKDDAHRIYPKEPVFRPDTFMPVALFDRVQKQLRDRPVENRPNRRNQANHPLNGKMFCPDCDAPMVIGSATARDGTIQKYFVCGTYTKFYYEKCNANSVRWDKLDRASTQVLDRAIVELAGLEMLDIEVLTNSKLESELIESSRRAQRLLLDMAKANGVDLSIAVELPCDPFSGDPEVIEQHRDEITRFVVQVIQKFKATCESTDAQRVKRLAVVEKEIDKLGGLLEDAPSERLRKHWHERIKDLECERQQLEDDGGSLFDQWKLAVEHLKAVRTTLENTLRGMDAAVWNSFLEKVIPIMRVEEMRNGQCRRHVEGFRFVAKEAVKGVLFDALEICATRRGTG